MTSYLIDSVDNTTDVIDSRDVIARLEALEVELDDAWSGQCERTEGDDFSAWVLEMAENHEGTLQDAAIEYRALYALAAHGEDYSPDWQHGATLVRDSYFREYAMDLAEDIGAVNSEASWPNNCIDWDQAARELRMDYTAVEFDGVTYWVR